MVLDVHGKVFKTCVDEKFFILKVPQANPNPKPKLNHRVRVGINSWETDKR